MALQPLVIRRDCWHFRFWCFWEGKVFDHPRAVKEGPLDTCLYYGDLTAYFGLTILVIAVVIAALVGLIWLTITKPLFVVGFLKGSAISLATFLLLTKTGLGRSIANRYRATERRLCRPIEIVDGVIDHGVARNEGVSR